MPGAGRRLLAGTQLLVAMDPPSGVVWGSAVRNIVLPIIQRSPPPLLRHEWGGAGVPHYRVVGRVEQMASENKKESGKTLGSRSQKTIRFGARRVFRRV